MTQTTPDDVLTFWFGELDDDGLATPQQRKRWFEKSPAFDQEIRNRFRATYDAVSREEKEAWLDTPRGGLAYVIVLDQLSRNMFRDSPAMYAEDARALRAAEACVDRGDDQKLRPAERAFLYMPFMHAEDLVSQRRCEALMAAGAESLQGPAGELFRDNHRYAVRHREIVERFGRFPHRNALLGRESTPEELAFLQGPGSSF